VAQSLAAKYPNARFLICADDDRATKEKTGKNPGVDAARATVLALNKGQQKGQKRARFVAPEGLKEGGSDFNDLAAASGLDAVKQQIEAAIGGKPKWPQAQEPKGGDGGVSVPPSLDRSRPRFAVNDDGVWYSGVDKEGNQLPPFLVCSPLHVTARTRDAESLEWGYLLEVPDYEGTPHQWAMPARLLAGDGNEYRSNLLSMGLRITPGSSAKNLLTQYLQTVKVDAFARCVDVTGWHDRVFVLPDRAIGNTAEKYIFQSAAAVNNTFKQKGSAEEWKEHIGKHCAGNSRLAFAVSVAFAGALLKLTGLESGGFHFRGHSGIGKTCALRVASSVYGGENFMQRWRATDNAMEGMATQHSDTVLVLDEIGQADPKVIGECVYMFSNDAGKGRASRTGAPRARMTWRLLFFSSGEKTLAEHMGEANKRVNAGQEVRLCDIPADTGSGFHLFENLGDFPGAKELHRHFMDKTRAYYGAVGIAWLQRLAADFDALPERIKALREKVVAKMVPSVASGQVYRAADRFALVAVAGELATEYGLTGWERGEAVKAAEVCFSAWLESRGGLVAVEEMQMLAQARRFLEQNDNRFTWCGRALDDHAPSIPNRCGFKRTFRDGKPYEYKGKDDAAQPDELVTVYYVLPESFKNELCKGFDLKAMCRLLRDSGVLECGKDSFTRSERLPGLGNVRCYRIVPAKFDDDLNGADDAGTDAAEVNGYSSAPDDDCPF
jgi:putative DNA primase/helicase